MLTVQYMHCVVAAAAATVAAAAVAALPPPWPPSSPSPPPSSPPPPPPSPPPPSPPSCPGDTLTYYWVKAAISQSCTDACAADGNRPCIEGAVLGDSEDCIRDIGNMPSVDSPCTSFNQCGTGGNAIDCPYNARATLSESPSLDPNGFFKPKLLNGSVEYDVDLSQTNCGCVAAFYTVALPAIGQDG